MGGWQSILGRAVRERRRELELTLDEASRAIGISRSHLNLIELGKATGVSGEAVAQIDAGLAAQGALVALLLSKDAAGVTRGEEMRRAEFNKAVVALAAALLLDRERLIGSENVDAALLEDHESLTRDFAHRQHRARPQTILEPIRAHLSQLLSLENTSLSPSMRQRLDRVIAETAALAGWVAFRSNGDLVTAHAQLALGRQHAREAGDDMLLAQLLAATSSLHSSLDLPRRGEDQSSPLALSLLQAAQRKAGSGSLPVHGWIAVRLAMEQALRGDTRRARPLLGRAEVTLPSQPSGDSAGLFVIWDESRFPGWAGKTLLLMRDPAATGLLEHALAVTTAPHPRLGLLVDLAWPLPGCMRATPTRPSRCWSKARSWPSSAASKGSRGGGSRRGEADSRQPSSAPLTADCTRLPRTICASSSPIPAATVGRQLARAGRGRSPVALLGEP
jgi:transcriptional regulator with XRE-family HTH domain